MISDILSGERLYISPEQPDFGLAKGWDDGYIRLLE
jgi:hypothetical protein